MSTPKQQFIQVLETLPIAKGLIQSYRARQRQRDWSTAHHTQFGATSLHVFTTVGLGDIMIAKQLCDEFREYCGRVGDPRLGRIVITAGAWPTEFVVERGDHNIYWWWSMNGQSNWLDNYISKVNVRPDLVACLSKWCVDQAQSLGCKTVFMPLAAGARFCPLGLERRGIGYAGTKGHKDASQVATVIGPFERAPDFEWVDHYTTPEQLNDFYNRKRIVLGMTETYQEMAGMVNNRVFEVLATDTPFIISSHRSLGEVLGFEYPYQARTSEDAGRLAREILNSYPAHQARFTEFGRRVRGEHSYRVRFNNLFERLSHNGR
jgi:hypothetical protein